MSSELLLTNARVVGREELFDGSVRIRDGLIADVERGVSILPRGQDLDGDYLLPGLVELHTDNLEKHFSPRPGVRWHARSAVMAHDAQIVSAGITTVFDALALGDVLDGSTRINHLEEMAEAVTRMAASGMTRAEHHLHLRCELSYSHLMELFERFVGEEIVKLVSVMDHAPGQRQFADMDKFREYYQGKYKMSDRELELFIDRVRSDSAKYSDHHRRDIVKMSRDRDLPVASHDDATGEHIDEAVEFGMVIAEFPTTIAAARAASDRGMHVLMGAPNLVRGFSHSGNVSARELAGEGLLDTLSSDYFPASLMHAAFVMADEVEGITLPDAVATVSANPAEAAGMEDRGRIETGRRADLVRVRVVDGLPIVREVWRRGQRVA